VLGPERKDVDAVKIAIGSTLDQLLDPVYGLRIGRLPQSG